MVYLALPRYGEAACAQPTCAHCRARGCDVHDLPASQPRTRCVCLPAAETHACRSRVRNEVSSSVSQSVAFCETEEQEQEQEEEEEEELTSTQNQRPVVSGA